MPLTSGDGDTLTTLGFPLDPATFGSADALWQQIVNTAIGAALGWLDRQEGDFCGPITDYGPGALDVRYQRYCYNGLGARLEASADGDEWFPVFGYTFTPTDPAVVYAFLEKLVDRTLDWLGGAIDPGGRSFSVAGVDYAALGAPMTSIAIGHVKKLVLSLQQGSEPLNLSFYFRRTDSASGSTGEADLIGDFRTNVEPALLDCMSADVSLLQYRVEDRISAGATNGHLRTFIGEALSAVVGSGAAADTSNIYQAAGCLSWYTNFSGRGERGRTFIPGLPAAFVDNGLLQEAAITAYQAFADAIIGNFNGDSAVADWQFVLWRSHVSGTTAEEGNPPAGQDGHVPPKTQPPFNPLAAAHGITLGVPQRTVRTLRRRGVGVRIGRRSGG